jgi:hypothetical protein
MSAPPPPPPRPQVQKPAPYGSLELRPSDMYRYCKFYVQRYNECHSKSGANSCELERRELEECSAL